MLCAGELGILQWQYAYVYADKQRAELTDSDRNALRAMRYYFRANERPPASLVNRTLAIISLYKARQEGLTRRLKVATKRKARIEAVRARCGSKLAPRISRPAQAEQGFEVSSAAVV